MRDVVSKAFSLPETIDPNHTYVYKTGDYGMYRYWYIDNFRNYWEYTNAPKGDPDYDPTCGEAVMVQDQPMPHTTPQFYAPNGKKLTLAIPDGVEVSYNPNYDPYDRHEVWYGAFVDPDTHVLRFLYLDSDVRENIDLWYQYNLRIVDYNIPAYRKYAVNLFSSPNVKDRTVGAILMLLDQCVYSIDELCNATVGDIEFIDRTVKLCGRKFLCDSEFYDFLTSIVAGRDQTDPLFIYKTFYGEEPISPTYLGALFYAMKMQPRYLCAWHANYMLVNIAHRMLVQGVPEEEVEKAAYSELVRAFNSVGDMKYVLDYKIHDRLFSNYAESLHEMETAGVEKSISAVVDSDDFGVCMLYSNLTDYLKHEANFSMWLHIEPMHELSKQQAMEFSRYLEQLTSDTEEGNVADDRGEDN